MSFLKKLFVDQPPISLCINFKMMDPMKENKNQLCLILTLPPNKMLECLNNPKPQKYVVVHADQ